MSCRLRTISGHVLAPVSCVAVPTLLPTSPLDSPSGMGYPRGTPPTLMGNLEPVNSEIVGELMLVQGSLPADLDGRYIRNGPNPFLARYGQPGYHEFTGDGMVHMVDIKGGKAIYRNRWVRTKRMRLDETKGKISKQREYIDEEGRSMGPANTSVVHHAGKLLALYDSDRPYALEPETLDTMDHVDFDGRLRNMTAHPKICACTGELVFVGSQVLSPSFDYGVLGRDGKLETFFEVPTSSGRMSFMHDLAITQNFSVLFEFPLFLDLKLAMSGKSAMPYIFDPSAPTMIAVVPRHAKSAEEVQWFKGATQYCFHFANAWEEDGGNIIKVLGVPAPEFTFADREYFASRLCQWTLNRSTGEVSEQELSVTNVDFPEVNPTRVGLPHQYVFCMEFAKGYPEYHCVVGAVKYDLSTGEVTRHRFQGERWGGESVFVPRTNGAGVEDDGYLITYTYNRDGSTELYIIDARTMDANPIAILRTPQRVPFGIHGTWIPRSSLDA